MKNRKIKIKEKYSRKHIGGSAVTNEERAARAAEIRAEQERLLSQAAQRRTPPSGTTGLNIQLKTIQNDLFAKLNKLNDQELKNLTTPMIEAVKRISSRPEMETESGPKKITTIYDEIDRFLVSLNDTPPNLEFYPSQIYYIDNLLQFYNSKSPTSLFSSVSAKSLGDKLYAFDNERFIKLRSKVKETCDLPDTSNKFKDQLRKMLADIEAHRNKKMKPDDLKLRQSISSKPTKQVITQSVHDTE